MINSKSEAIDIIKCLAWHTRPNEEDIEQAIEALEQEPKIWSLDDAREDFMHDVYNTLDFLPTNNEANQIIDSFDRVTSSIMQEPCDDAISRADVKKYLSAPDANGDRVIYESDLDLLPPVTPQPKVGRWEKAFDEHSYWYKCSCCGEKIPKNFYGNDYFSSYCPNCGAKMESEDAE